MNFQDIATRFEHAESGTDSAKVLFKDAFNMMKSTLKTPACTSS